MESVPNRGLEQRHHGNAGTASTPASTRSPIRPLCISRCRTTRAADGIPRQNSRMSGCSRTPTIATRPRFETSARRCSDARDGRRVSIPAQMSSGCKHIQAMSLSRIFESTRSVAAPQPKVRQFANDATDPLRQAMGTEMAASAAMADITLSYAV
jgi:hypothetical protein